MRRLAITISPAERLARVELMPKEAGEYVFSCQMGMLRGRLIIEQAT